MKKTSGYTVVTVVLAFALCQFSGLRIACAQEGAVISVDEVIKNADPTTVTKAQIKLYLESVKGKDTRGEGVVVDVLPGRSRSADQVRVTILTPASKPNKGYNVVLYTTKQAITDLNINDRVSFEGKIRGISSIRGVSVDVIGTYKKVGGTK